MQLLVAAILLLLFIWVFGEVSDRLPEKHSRRKRAVKKH